MTKRQAQNVAAVIGRKGRSRLVRLRPDEGAWAVVVPCNEHDSATSGCLVVSDGSVKQIMGVKPDQYDPRVLYDDTSLSCTINYDDRSHEEEPDVE